ncbi:MAG: hypothetical protein QXL15_05120 [Candidatus Korarchaeota archaeon]
MGWFVGSAIVVMYLIYLTISVLLIIGVQLIRKYREKHSRIALYLIFHIVFFLVSFSLSALMLTTEYGHDYWNWEVPYLRRYVVGIGYGFSAIGIVFLVLFINAVFGLRKTVKYFLIIYGILLFPIMAHPDNHWEVIEIEPYTFDLRPISEPLFVFYLIIVGTAVAFGGFRAASKASEKQYEVALRFIGFGGVCMLLAVVFLLIDTYIAIFWVWHYNVASWISWILIMLAAICFYCGYTLPKFIMRLLKI